MRPTRAQTTAASADGGVFRPARLAGKGFALIAVMWVVLIAGLMLLGVQRAVRANLAMAYGELASVRAQWLARAGVEQAMAVLQDDYAGSDGALDDWYAAPDLFQEVELVGGTFSVTAPPGPMSDPRAARYGLVDHSARLNVNVAEAKQLKSLCDLADWRVNSILDWRDPDNNALPGGAEALHYRRLEYPYRIRNGPLQTVEELLLVRGIDRSLFAGEDANLNGILDANEDDLRASLPNDDGDGQLALGLGGLMTVYSYELNRDADGGKRVNVNSVEKKTLVQQFNFTDALAEGVVNYGSGGSRSGSQKGPGSSGKAPAAKFTSLMDLLKVQPKQTSARGGSSGSASGDSGADDEKKVERITLKWLAEHFDELTLTDEDRLPARINVNTAPRQVLMTLPKMKRTTAEAICRRQAAGEGPFDSVGELLTSKTVTDEQFKAFAERVTVRSSVFEIRSTGVTKWGIRRRIVAVVDRGNAQLEQADGSADSERGASDSSASSEASAQPMTILYWHQSE